MRDVHVAAVPQFGLIFTAEAVVSDNRQTAVVRQLAVVGAVSKCQSTIVLNDALGISAAGNHNSNILTDIHITLIFNRFSESIILIDEQLSANFIFQRCAVGNNIIEIQDTGIDDIAVFVIAFFDCHLITRADIDSTGTFDFSTECMICIDIQNGIGGIYQNIELHTGRTDGQRTVVVDPAAGKCSFFTIIDPGKGDISTGSDIHRAFVDKTGAKTVLGVDIQNGIGIIQQAVENASIVKIQRTAVGNAAAVDAVPQSYGNFLTDIQHAVVGKDTISEFIIFFEFNCTSVFESFESHIGIVDLQGTGIAHDHITGTDRTFDVKSTLDIDLAERSIALVCQSKHGITADHSTPCAIV